MVSIKRSFDLEGRIREKKAVCDWEGIKHICRLKGRIKLKVLKTQKRKWRKCMK